MIISIPLNNNVKFNVIVIKKNYNILIYNEFLYLKYIIPLNSNLNIIPNLNFINLKLKIFNHNLKNKNLTFSFFYNIGKYFSKKILFSGKGYKIKKKKSSIFFYFNKSHFNIFIYKNILFKKIKKNKLILKSSNNNFMFNLLKTITNIRNINLYTLKGIRISRQVVYKKIGKKSS